ncbi:MAG: M28 family peptidase [Rubrobacteridae bacterium]|nr:M28 family peptidase [Rubrobacteridae bacterium]
MLEKTGKYQNKIRNLLLVVIAGMFCALITPLPSQSASKPVFNADKAFAHAKYLSSNIGYRIAGSANEHKSAIYIKKQLDAYGYATSLQVFKLPNNKLSYNVAATLKATKIINNTVNKSPQAIILGAHYDSKGGPGANDNGSGVGVLLELARVAALQQNRSDTLRFVFFGAEERVGTKRNDHHFGSRYYVNKHMSASTKKNTKEMICVDMVGNGKTLTLRSLKEQPDSLSKKMLIEATALKIPVMYKQAGDDSDFEAFERANIPSTWVEWRLDNNWHTPRDTYDRLNIENLSYTGKLLQKHLITTL